MGRQSGTRRARGARRLTALLRPRTIGASLTRILVVSLAVVSVLLVVSATREVREYRDSGEVADAVTLALAVQDLLHEIQRERGLTNGWLGGDWRLQGAVADQRVHTDRALRSLDGAATTVAGAEGVRAARASWSELSAIRDRVDAGSLPRAAAFQYFTGGIEALDRLRPGLDQADDAEVRRGLHALYALGEVKEYTARERGFLNGVWAAGGFAPGEYVQLLDIRAARVAALDAFARDAAPARQAMLDALLAGAEAQRAAEAEAAAVASAGGAMPQAVDPIDWWAWMTAVIDGERVVQQAVGADVVERSARLREQAAWTLGGFLVLALLAVAAQIALVVAGIRGIVRPLAALAAEADDIAHRRLPEVIAAWHDADETAPDAPRPVRAPAGAAAEIAAVAAAFDRVQTTAVQLAAEQALLRRNSTESMANLARRNQNLVRRQLGLISEFERDELDAQTLSNLFRLDHLATRIRRNAESLLVLLGQESPRRGAAPLALTDVLRAGMSEVDDYRRVVLRRVDDIAVTGSVGSELAHILAELIENGLTFSPPEHEVEIHGKAGPDGYLVAVVDSGIGMPPDRLAEANARLRGERDFLLAPTRHLGHYVVGRLARRSNITVELRNSPVSGIVARLHLPPEILVTERVPSGFAAQGAAGTSPPPTSRATSGSPRGAGALAHAGTGVGDDIVRGGVARSVRAGDPHGAGVASGVSRDGRTAVETTDSPDVPRTRNGLVKRNRQQRAPQPTARPEPSRPSDAPVSERTPEQVRGMLTDFRAAVRAGAQPLRRRPITDDSGGDGPAREPRTGTAMSGASRPSDH